MTEQRHIRRLILAVAGFFAVQGALAQHTLGVIGGYGMGSGRFDPKQETRAIWGLYSGGLTWRYYGTQRFVGAFGVDLEFQQQAFSFATNASQVDERETANYLYYTRRINSMVLPVVWQPHFYLLKNHVRVYFEAAATFFYNFSSTWEQEYFVDAETKQKDTYGGTYSFKVPRDNRWGYGLAGGGGISFLIRRFELNFRARYYFGYSDIVRNRNRYYDNSDDGPENPFYTTPMRSPLDNLTISVGVSYRFNKEGFETWKPRPKREKNREEFKFGQ
ncbi:outer membrane beta-barrel protein [uncultured Alistipes sp.]|uniref:outer membrane beta-barrel protein n=1 Tax=uncultured Alistipes sp. TaxID=538949 RepID=UPI003208A993